MNIGSVGDKEKTKIKIVNYSSFNPLTLYKKNTDFVNNKIFYLFTKNNIPIKNNKIKIGCLLFN